LAKLRFRSGQVKKCNYCKRCPPTAAEDGQNGSPEDVRYSVVRYLASPIPMPMDLTLVESKTLGEILGIRH